MATILNIMSCQTVGTTSPLPYRK